MTQEDEITALAFEMRQCAEKADFEKLADLMPSPEQFSDFMKGMFLHIEVVDQYEKKVLGIKSSGSP